MRKLASIQKIWKIEPIPDADQIELVHVLGWQCVANKNQFSETELAIYFEIDSFLPVRPEFEFLRSSSFKKSELMGEGFKLRTMKFRGQISQGLVLPLDLFPEIAEHPELWEIGTDVAELLGVRKWETEERASTGGTIIGSLPDGVPHTDETRVQSAPELLEEFAGLPYYITTKMDGTSCSLMVDEEGCHVCGHNVEYKRDDACSFYQFVSRRGYLEEMCEYVQRHGIKKLVVQGEFCAPGIQKNRLKLTAPEWYVFTVIVDGKRLPLEKMVGACTEMNMIKVPIEETGRDFGAAYPTVDSLLERAQGEYPNGGQKEGIVIRTMDPVFTRTTDSGYLSMKVLNNKYLLKNGE